MPESEEYVVLPFLLAIEFFQQKLNMPTETWREIWKEMHGRAFSVAGAIKTDLIEDLRVAVNKGIEDGTTIDEFRNDFDQIVSAHGWKYRGGREWRTAVIFNTNLSVAYSRGHYQQSIDPAVKSVRPYFRYVPSYSANRREEHKKWYNIILPVDDPFWNTHYPPNGWGCKCGIVSHSKREVARLTKEEASGPFPVKQKAPKMEHYKWTNKKTGEIHNIPVGIDPGWDYHVGKSGFRDGVE